MLWQHITSINHTHFFSESVPMLHVRFCRPKFFSNNGINNFRPFAGRFSGLLNKDQWKYMPITESILWLFPKSIRYIYIHIDIYSIILIMQLSWNKFGKNKKNCLPIEKDPIFPQKTTLRKKRIDNIVKKSNAISKITINIQPTNIMFIWQIVYRSLYNFVICVKLTVGRIK